MGLETAGRKLRPAAGTAQERRILQALAWLGFEDEAPRAAQEEAA